VDLLGALPGAALLALLLAALAALAPVAYGAGAPGGDLGAPAGGPAALEVPGEQFFMVPGEAGTVRVLQRTLVFNPGPWAAEQVEIPVPVGARLFDPPEGWGDVAPGGRGLVDARPLAPGEVREYRVLYELMMGSRPYPVRRALPYPVGEMAFWVEDGALALTGLHLEDRGTEEMAGGQFRLYTMGPVGPHDNWQVVLRPPLGRAGRALPELSGHGARHADPWAVWREGLRRYGKGAILLVAGVAAVAWRRRRARLRAEGKGLEEALVALEVAHRAGEVDTALYQAQKRQLLARLARGNPSRRRGSPAGKGAAQQGTRTQDTGGEQGTEAIGP